LKRKSLGVIGVAVAAVIIGGGAYLYFTQFAPQSVIQTNPDTVNCRHGNVLANVDRPSRFTVLSTCEMAVGIVMT